MKAIPERINLASPVWLNLLDDIERGLVLVDRWGLATYHDEGHHTKAVRRWPNLVQAGLAVRPPGSNPPWQPGRLTEAGRAALGRR